MEDVTEITQIKSSSKPTQGGSRDSRWAFICCMWQHKLCRKIYS